MHPTHSLLRILSTALLIQLGMTAGLSAQQPGTSPVKIYLMIGQSNMEGHGEINPVGTQGTLEYIVANDPGNAYQFLKSGGNWVVRDDVWMHYERLGASIPRVGNLEPGYGANGSNVTIGPELGFGHKMGNTHGNQVLLVKAAWGGRSLGNDFLPPSSGSNPAAAREYGDPGYYYQQTLRLVEDATSKLATYFPNYNGQGYEIAGICWHQGFNDRVTPAYSTVYETNMANFIRDIRSDLGVPGLPFVIATTGMGGGSTYTQVELAQRAMVNPSLTNPALPNRYAAFVGNVAVVDTRATYSPLGLDFWQPVANSPANQDYHWNRNAKTYLHIGLAMGHEMPLLTSPRCPSRLLATGGAPGVTLTWQNGTEMPTSVQVLRDGVPIAAAAPVSPASFTDTTALPGVHNYQLVFTMPGVPCDPLTVSHNSAISGLTAYRSQNGVVLGWTNNLGYAGIQIQRNGSTIAAALAGSPTSYEDTTAPATGLLTYTVVPTTGTSTPAQVQINLGPHTSPGALIYEPFDIPAGASLHNLAPSGFGLSGNWTRHSGSTSNEFRVASEGLSYGTLPAAGNRVRNNVTGGGRANNVAIGNVLANEGLLADGATLWFSTVVRPVSSVNTICGIGLVSGTSTATIGSYTNSSNVNGVGINLNGGNDVEYCAWKTGITDTYLRASAKPDLTLNLTYLIVCKLVWGSGGGNDTFEIFMPDLSLNQGTRLGAVQSIDIDQTTLNRIAIYDSGGSIEFDDIRFGASYLDVTGQGADTSGDFTAPTPAMMSFASPPTATSQSAITMTATTASDANGVQYQFLESTGRPGSTDSAWQDSPVYTDTGLDPGTEYTYTVQARDKSVNNNPNTLSTSASATTLAPDTTPPPVPTLVTPLGPITATEITMTANAVTDPEGGAVEYRFHNVTLSTHSSWQAGTSFTASGLTPETPYEFTVQARDSASPPNESATSSPAVSATTLVSVQTTYVRQNNTTLLNATGAWSPAGTPGIGDIAAWTAAIGTAGNRTTALGGSVSWGQILMNATDPGGDITIGNTAGAVLSLNGISGTGIDMSLASRSLIINNPITLGSSQIWNVNASRTLTVGNYAIGDNGSAYGITKAGAGTLVLQGSNTFTGPINVTAGTLSIPSINNVDNANPLGQSLAAAANLLLGNATVLTYTGGAASSDRSFTINGTAAGHGATINPTGSGALNLTSTAAIGYGTVDQTRTLTLTGSNNLANTHVLAARITDNGSGKVTLSKTGAGNVWSLTNSSNSFTGGVQLGRGTLIFSSGALGTSGTISIQSNALPITLKWATGNTNDISSRWSFGAGSANPMIFDTGANDVTFASSLTGGTGTYVYKDGAGKLTLDGGAGNWTGTTIIREGILAAKTLANGGVVSSIGSSTSTSQGLGLRGGTLQYTGATTAPINRNFHLSASSTIDASGSGALVFNQTGIISPNPVKTSVTINLNNKVIITGNTADIVAGMKVSGAGIPANTTITSVDNNNQITINNNPTGTTTGTPLTFGSYSPGVPITLTLTGTNTGANEIKGILRDSISAISGDTSFSALGITKTGVGKWVLTGANTYTGATTINDGTLALGANHVLPDGSAVSMGAATLDVATFSDTLGTLDVTGAATINLGTGATLAFAASDSINSGTWAGGLDIFIDTLEATSIRFGNGSSALTPGQLAKIQVNGAGTYTLDSNGYLVASAAGSAYDIWKATNAPTGNPDDDFDGDGVSNAVEFVLGGTSATKDLDKLPVSSTSGSDMLFTFFRKQSSIDPKTGVSIEVGTDLVTWNAPPSPYAVPDGAAANNPGVTVEKDNPAPGTDKITLRVPMDTDTKKFGRLKVVITP